MIKSKEVIYIQKELEEVDIYKKNNVILCFQQDLISLQQADDIWFSSEGRWLKLILAIVNRSLSHPTDCKGPLGEPRLVSILSWL